MQDTKELGQLNMANLVLIHNLLAAPDKQAAGKTFSQRSKAVDRILKLAEEQGIDLAARLAFSADEADAENPWKILPLMVKPVEPATSNVVPLPVTVKPRDESLQAAIEAGTGDKPATQPTPIKKAGKKAAAPAEPKPPKGPSIRSVAEKLLMEVVGVDGDKRKVGLSYKEILDKIKEQFPGANTTVACLRWYGVHMREKGTMPPSRPRAVPAKEEPAKEEPKADTQPEGSEVKS